MSNRRRPELTPMPPPAGKAADPAADLRDHLLTALTLAVLALAFVRCLVPVTPNLYWESDPRQTLRMQGVSQADLLAGESDEIPVQFFGPAGTAMLDAMSVAIAGLALIVHVKVGGMLRWGSIGLALTGIGFCFLHLQSNVENTFICGGWIGAISLGLAILHLATRDRQRRWVLAALAGLAVSLFVEAARYVFLEHQETVDLFKQHEDAYLAARGWLRGSPEHLMYQRRMEFGEPTGAFTFSNILGSVSASIAMLAALITYGLWQGRRLLKQRWILPAIVALLAGWTMLLTHSKGAPVALVMACGLVGLILVSVHKQRGLIFIPAAAVALLLVAVAVVLVRGAMGPPSTAEGERSLLFRWHYWQAAARISTQSVSSVLVGVGPAQFGEDYHWAKNPINPEEVRSAHNVFVDYIAMLGIGGLALATLLITWLVRGAVNSVKQFTAFTVPIPQHIAAEPTATRSAFEVTRADLFWTLAFLAAIFGVDFAIRGASYGTPERFLIWSAGMTGTFFVMAVLVSRDWLPRGVCALALLAAAAVLLIHGQIEMTFYQASSAPLAWLIVAAAAAGREGTPSRTATTPLPLVPGVVLLLLTVLLVTTIAFPLTRQQAMLARAERTLRDSPASWPVFNQTLLQLREVETIGPLNPKPYEWQSRLAMEAAVHLNAGLRDVPPAQVRPEARTEIRRLVLLSLDALERAPAQGLHTISLRRQQAQMFKYAADILGDPSYVERSIAVWREMIALRPHAWQDQMELGDLLWSMDRKALAAPHYRRAIALSDMMRLEPTRQMSENEYQRIRVRSSAD